MRKLPINTLLVCATLLLSTFAMGQQPVPAGPQQFVYPARHQTPERQRTDEAECHLWAVQQSGYDPANPPMTATAQAAPVTGSGARMRGAAAGAAVGAIGGNDVGNAAVKGAVAGGVVRRSRNRRAAAQANQAAAQQQQGQMSDYQRARRTCLEGRGYSVK